MSPRWEIGSWRVALGGYFLGVAWLGLDFARVNVPLFGGFDPALVVVVGLLCGGVFLAGVAVALAGQWWTPACPPARLLSTVTVLVGASFAHLSVRVFATNRLGLSDPWPGLLFIVGLVTAVAVTWHFSRYSLIRLSVALTSMMMFAFGVAGLGAVAWELYFTREPPRQVASIERSAAKLSGDNVYYIVLDQYSGPAALRAYAGADINPFLNRMAGLGFTRVLRARANYTTTYVALTAMLEMNYVATPDGERYRDRKRFFPSALSREPAPALLDRLRDGGYAFIHIGNWWNPCRQSARVTCLDHGDEHAFKKQLVNVFFEPLQLRTLWGTTGQVDAEEVTAPLRELRRALGTLPGPSFVFTHHMPPHEPFLTADCQLFLEPRHEPAQYAASIECVNQRVEYLASAIVAEDPGAIVVFQGDHGSDFTVDAAASAGDWRTEAIIERTSILNLIRAPEACRPWLRDGMSPVNTVRFVIGCLERQQPDYLPEKTYISAYEGQLDFGLVRDVTGLVQRTPEGGHVDGNTR